jgi:hypothetical protein
VAAVLDSSTALLSDFVSRSNGFKQFLTVLRIRFGLTVRSGRRCDDQLAMPDRIFGGLCAVEYFTAIKTPENNMIVFVILKLQ